jgi:8-oxo-dGTP pyrophosphatase MutT (NUDIX family)
MTKPWERLSSEVLHSFKIFALRTERYVSPRTGQSVPVVVLECGDWVNVVALTPAQEVVMIRQFRFGTGQVTLEIPGGIIDPGETPLDAARRELREETGFEAARFTSLGAIAPNPAIHRNRLHCFLAEDCRLSAVQDQDPGEDIHVELLPLARVDALLASQEIDHALVAIAFQKLALLRAGHVLV